MIKRSVLYLLAICILSVIHKLRKYDVWVPSDPSQPPSLPRATDFPGLMWTGKPVGRKTPLPKSCDSAVSSLQPLWRGLSSKQRRTVRSVRVRCAASWRLGKPPCLSSIMKRAISWQLQIKRSANDYSQSHPLHLPKEGYSPFSFSNALSLSIGGSFTYDKVEDTASSLRSPSNQSFDDSPFSVRRDNDALCITGRAGP